jgi:hypothetical protein
MKLCWPSFARCLPRRIVPVPSDRGRAKKNVSSLRYYHFNRRLT